MGGTKRDFAVFASKITSVKKKSAAKFLCVKTSNGKVIAISFLYQMVYRRIAGDLFTYLNLRLKVSHSFRERRFRQISHISASVVRASEKSSIISNRKSTMRFPSSHKWTLCVTLKSPKGVSKREFLHFSWRFISLLQLIVDTSNLVCRLIIASLSLRMTNCPWNGRGHVAWSTLNFKALNIFRNIWS